MEDRIVRRGIAQGVCAKRFEYRRAVSKIPGPHKREQRPRKVDPSAGIYVTSVFAAYLQYMIAQDIGKHIPKVVLAILECAGLRDRPAKAITPNPFYLNTRNAKVLPRVGCNLVEIPPAVVKSG